MLFFTTLTLQIPYSPNLWYAISEQCKWNLSLCSVHSLSNYTLPSDHCSRHPILSLTQSCWSLHTNPEVFTLSWFFSYIFFLFFRQKGITFSVFIAAYPEASSPLSDTTLSSFHLLTTLSSAFVSFVIFLPGFLDTVSVSQPLFHNVHSKHVTLESFIKHRRLLLSSFIIDGNRFKTWFWSSDDMPVARNPDFKFSEDNRLIDRANNNDNGSASGSWEYNHLS